MTSPARWASLTIRSSACRTSARSGGRAFSQRRPAWALVAAAAMGWSLRAIEAVSCPWLQHGSRARPPSASRGSALASRPRLLPACARSTRDERKPACCFLRSSLSRQHRHAPRRPCEVLLLNRWRAPGPLATADGPCVEVLPFRRLRSAQLTRPQGDPHGRNPPCEETCHWPR